MPRECSESSLAPRPPLQPRSTTTAGNTPADATRATRHDGLCTRCVQVAERTRAGIACGRTELAPPGRSDRARAAVLVLALALARPEPAGGALLPNSSNPYTNRAQMRLRSSLLFHSGLVGARRFRWCCLSYSSRNTHTPVSIIIGCIYRLEILVIGR